MRPRWRVTPSFDRYSGIVNALGDRFILLRLHDVAANEQAASALRRQDRDAQMRVELAGAMTGLIQGAQPDLVGRELEDREVDLLIKLATYTARARTAVERDGYSHELVVSHKPKAPPGSSSSYVTCTAGCKPSALTNQPAGLLSQELPATA
jgi:hypothetical protein